MFIVQLSKIVNKHLCTDAVAKCRLYGSRFRNQIDDAVDDLGFVGLLTFRNVAGSAMEVEQPLGRLPQLGFTGLAGALFSHCEQS